MKNENKNKPTELPLEQKVKAVFFTVIILAGIIYWVWPSSDPEPEKQLTPAEKRQQLVETCFSHWDGRHIELAKLLKNNMNDPKSFEHVETTYRELGDTLIVSMKYRGKNQFGGKVLGLLIAKTLTNTCNVVEILHQE